MPKTKWDGAGEPIKHSNRVDNIDLQYQACRLGILSEGNIFVDYTKFLWGFFFFNNSGRQLTPPLPHVPSKWTRQIVSDNKAYNHYPYNQIMQL